MIKSAIREILSRTGLIQNRFNSQDYWANRYEEGGNSGAGSYGRLAQYKADFINSLVAERSISSVVEFGSGDGNQASMFDFDNYTGVDVVAKVVELCNQRFASRTGWQFIVSGKQPIKPSSYDMAMSLDVIYHLVEDQVFNHYMTALFDAADRYVLIYASDHDEFAAEHVRSRKYSDWIGENAKSFEEIQSWENPYPHDEAQSGDETSMAFFRLYARK